MWVENEFCQSDMSNRKGKRCLDLSFCKDSHEVGILGDVCLPEPMFSCQGRWYLPLLHKLEYS